MAIQPLGAGGAELEVCYNGAGLFDDAHRLLLVWPVHAIPLISGILKHTADRIAPVRFRSCLRVDLLSSWNRNLNNSGVIVPSFAS